MKRHIKHFFFTALIIVWKTLPRKIFFSNLIKKQPYLKNKLYQDLRYVGVMKIHVEDKYFLMYNPGFTTIENELFWNGLDGWEKISMKIWVKLARNADFILDIGANTGIYSLIASTVNPTALVYAFEPVRRTYELTKKNCELNNSTRIHLFTQAVSNVNGRFIFYDVPSISQYSASLNEEMLNYIPDRVHYEVDTIRIDSISEICNRRVNLIKLDVEMHEPEALEGMLEILIRDRPTLLIEILNDEIALKVQKLLGDLNYSYFSIDELSGLTRIDKIQKSTMYNLLVIREDLSYLIVDEF